MRITDKDTREALDALKKRGIDLLASYYQKWVRFVDAKTRREVTVLMGKREGYFFLTGINAGLDASQGPFRTEVRTFGQKDIQQVLFISTAPIASKEEGNVLFDAIANGKVPCTVVAHMRLADGIYEAYIQVPCDQQDLMGDIKHIRALIASDSAHDKRAALEALDRLMSRWEKGRE